MFQHVASSELNCGIPVATIASSKNQNFLKSICNFLNICGGFMDADFFKLESKRTAQLWSVNSINYGGFGVEDTLPASRQKLKGRSELNGL